MKMQVEYKGKIYHVDYDEEGIPDAELYTLYINGKAMLGCLAWREVLAVLNNPAEIAWTAEQEGL